MNQPAHSMTIEEALAAFHAVTREVLGDTFGTGTTVDQTPEEEEDCRFRFAELLLSLACPDPRECDDPRCRRTVGCRHYARVQAKQASGSSNHPRRTPGAEAVRYAIWVYMSSGR